MDLQGNGLATSSGDVGLLVVLMVMGGRDGGRIYSLLLDDLGEMEDWCWVLGQKYLLISRISLRAGTSRSSSPDPG